MRRSLCALLLLVSAAGAAAADDPPTTIVLRDHQWVPGEVAIPAGVKVQLVIRNEQAVAAEFESTSLHREKIVPPGAQVSVYVGPLSAGRYEFFDDFHTAARGVLVVK
jgi:hypothetical protein